MENGIYRHYKGGLYQLLIAATHTESDEVLCVYKSLSNGKFYARPIDMFFGNVPLGTGVVKRFELVQETAQC